MATFLTVEFLTQYIRDKKRHNAYIETCKIAQDLRVHSDGENGGDLIKERRPSESLEIMKYREKIFVAITEPVISKVTTSLSKIRRSSDWSIRYDKSKIPGGIIEEETLEDYCEEYYPSFGSVTKWIFDVYLKIYLTDPNAVIVTLTDIPADQTTYRKPYALAFYSEQVYDYVDGKYVVLYSTDKSEYALQGGKKMYDGDVYYTIDTEVIQRWVQVNAKGDMGLDYEIAHGMGRLPAFKVGGVFYKAMDKIKIQKSRINAMIPHLKEAVREYSDLQAEVVQHIHSEKWTYLTQDCTDCKGLGKYIQKGKQVQATCAKCSGSGKVTSTPYSAVVMAAPKPGEPTIPGGIPFGYVQKQIDIVKIQDERVDKHKYQALSAINMEFLAEVPLSQSGTAKQVDRDELNTFVDSIAEDIISAMDKIYANICDLRYMKIVPNKKQRKELLPKIAVPQNYDLLSSSYLLTELQAAKTAKLNSVTLIALEVEYANKKFNNDPTVRDELKTILELDPFPGLTDDEKLSRLTNDGILRSDYILSSNIYSIVRKSIDENDQFLELPLDKKREFVDKYINNILIQNSQAQQIINGIKIATGTTNLTEAMKGVTGMIEIATAVSTGTLSMDGAIALAADKFGITTDQAKMQLKNIVVKVVDPNTPPPTPPIPPVK